MNISIDLYRNRIGRFNLCCRNFQFGTNRRYEERSKCGKYSTYLKLLLLILICTGSSTFKKFDSNTKYSNHKWKPSNYLSQRTNVLVTETIGPSESLLSYSRKSQTINWSHCNVPNNQLGHALHGNRRLGYKIGFWNCRKKLISDTNFDTNKLSDVKAFFSKHNPHVFGVIESNLYGTNCPFAQFKKFSTEDVKSKLHIDG